MEPILRLLHPQMGCVENWMHSALEVVRSWVTFGMLTKNDETLLNAFKKK